MSKLTAALLIPGIALLGALVIVTMPIWVLAGFGLIAILIVQAIKEELERSRAKAAKEAARTQQ